MSREPSLFTGDADVFQRCAGASATSMSRTLQDGVQLFTGPGVWTAVHVPSTATLATIAKAAGGTGKRHVCTAITATISCGATAQTPIQIYLRDGLTTAGTILWAITVAAPANGMGGISVTGLNIVGTANTAMTLEFSAAGVAASQEAITINGFTVS